MHVCVLGAGIVGLAAAWKLQAQGHRITLVDRAEAGAGASGANGAQLSYAYVQPLADPVIWGQLPKLLLSAQSPLKLRLRWDPDQWRWGLAFLAACRASTSRDTTRALLALAAQSRCEFEQWLAQAPGDCDFTASGKLVLYRDEASFAAARRQLALQRSLGTEQSAVGGDECLAIEPALAGSGARFAGGIHTPGECAADCLKVCQALLHDLRQGGAQVLFGAEATQWTLRGGRAVALQTSAGPVEADAFVLAAGSASARLARPLGVRLPVYPLKGYSITLPASDAPAAAPRVSITDAARKLVFARIGARLRVAGMAELVGQDTSIPGERIERLLAGTRELFPDAGDFAATQPWAGLRPATPSGLPVVGRLANAPANVLFDTGHGALGFTLAFGSAAQVADAVGALEALRGCPAGPAPCSA